MDEHDKRWTDRQINKVIPMYHRFFKGRHKNVKTPIYFNDTLFVCTKMITCRVGNFPGSDLSELTLIPCCPGSPGSPGEP
jgi:hypothetical protein